MLSGPAVLDGPCRDTRSHLPIQRVRTLVSTLRNLLCPEPATPTHPFPRRLAETPGWVPRRLHLRHWSRPAGPGPGQAGVRSLLLKGTCTSEDTRPAEEVPAADRPQPEDTSADTVKTGVPGVWPQGRELSRQVQASECQAARVRQDVTQTQAGEEPRTDPRPPPRVQRRARRLHSPAACSHQQKSHLPFHLLLRSDPCLLLSFQRNQVLPGFGAWSRL